MISDEFIFALGQEVDRICIFDSLWDIPIEKLYIIKKETESCKYEITIRYASVDNRERSVWEIKINDQPLKDKDGRELWYHGSKAFLFIPLEKIIGKESKIIQIIEIDDENKTGVMYVNMENFTYIVSKSS